MLQFIIKVQSAEEACFSHSNTIQSQNICNRLRTELPVHLLGCFWHQTYSCCRNSCGHLKIIIETHIETQTDGMNRFIISHFPKKDWILSLKVKILIYLKMAIKKLVWLLFSSWWGIKKSQSKQILWSLERTSLYEIKIINLCQKIVKNAYINAFKLLTLEKSLSIFIFYEYYHAS